jgi:predicted esterase
MLSVPTTVHGRVLIESDGDAAVSSGVLAGFHGYGENAGDMMAALRLIPGASTWTRVSIQALNRFYTRGDAKVVANWMTREDREQAIADNIAYVNTALELVLARAEARALHQPGMEVPGFSPGRTPLVFVGFSQGVAMAYRAALMGARPVSGVIALAGDIPPELKTDVPARQPWPRVLIGVGDKEEWYSTEKVQGDLAFLRSHNVPHAITRFKGGHEWTDEFRVAAGEFLAV